MMTRLILTLALLAGPAHAALRGNGTGQSTPRPTNPTPTPDQPVTSWQPPFSIR